MSSSRIRQHAEKRQCRLHGRRALITSISRMRSNLYFYYRWLYFMIRCIKMPARYAALRRRRLASCSTFSSSVSSVQRDDSCRRTAHRESVTGRSSADRIHTISRCFLPLFKYIIISARDTRCRRSPTVADSFTRGRILLHAGHAWPGRRRARRPRASQLD